MYTTQILRKAGVGDKTTVRALLAHRRRSNTQKGWFALGLMVAFALLVVGFSLPQRTVALPMISIRGAVSTKQGVPCPGISVVLQGMGISTGTDLIIPTKPDGSWDASLPQGWTGMATLDSMDRIQPVGRDLHMLQADISRQDFVIFSSP